MLIDSMLKLIFLNSDYVEPYLRDVDDAVEEYEISLELCENHNEIRIVIELHADYYLPVPLMVDTFEKYLKLNRKDASVLRIYAEYIGALLPDWGDYANKLIKEADEIELKGS